MYLCTGIGTGLSMLHWSLRFRCNIRRLGFIVYQKSLIEERFHSAQQLRTRMLCRINWIDLCPSCAPPLRIPRWSETFSFRQSQIEVHFVAHLMCTISLCEGRTLNFSIFSKTRPFSVCYILKAGGRNHGFQYAYRNSTHHILFLSLNCTERGILIFSILPSHRVCKSSKSSLPGRPGPWSVTQRWTTNAVWGIVLPNSWMGPNFDFRFNPSFPRLPNIKTNSPSNYKASIS
jgi:hypothetical protein